MIVPMKKVSIVMLESEKRESLKALRALGAVHLNQIEGKGDALSALKESDARAIQSLSILSEAKAEKGAQPKPLDDEQADGKCREITGLFEKKKSLLDQIAADGAELERFAKWGDVDPADFEFLARKGIHLAMFESSADVYGEIRALEGVQTVLAAAGKKDARFLLVSADGSRPEGFPAGAVEVALPRLSTKALREEIARDGGQIKEIERAIALNACFAQAIGEWRARLAKRIEFENAASGMECEGGDSSSLAWISGYAPVDSMDSLKKRAAERGWALLSDDPAEADDPPTKLRNNRLVSFIYPLTNFLGTVPGYREFDISGWFLLFFSIFFGMIFGDAGYGALIMLIGLAMIVKAKKDGKPLGAGHGLIMLLGLATVVWGTVTCTWFGLTMDKIPDALKALSIPPISNAYADVYSGKILTTDQCLQIFCFSLAFLQLSVAHITCIAAHRKTAKWLGDFGSLLMLWGMFYVVLMLVVSGEVFSLGAVVMGIPVGMVALGCVGLGFVLSFVFSNFEGSVGRSILESCKNIISVILGVVNVFSDIVSYIRLWAVALAGSAISNTVNSMAGPMWGRAALFLAFVALLVFGHGLNIVLNVLSVIVHGVRLNTLEFSSHLGMAWSGYKYEPFCEAAK